MTVSLGFDDDCRKFVFLHSEIVAERSADVVVFADSGIPKAFSS